MQFSSLITISVIFIISRVSCKTRSRCYEGLCEHRKGYIYPTREIEEAVKSFELKVVLHPPNNDNNEVSTRSFNDIEAENLCLTKKKIFVPRFHKSQTNISIVQVEKFKQNITFETCVKAENCKKISKCVFGMKTVCKQTYQYTTLLTYNTHNQKLELKMFKLPSTCVCAKTSNIYPRTNEDNDV
ncbi:hypothetical protein TcasGA2_TC032149 [Tribolium castaneum]|uniref:Spaetzle domain-containing protein n=1 Tax=Tribolium castaneum TaxID=7070 RepID=A0A139WN49_TRICA|nr:PREDICTED: uncharacterized protein LOC103315068 [Tribolium castaneum]KYB29241.1 hypothetical protein TcasGA2_TC032149 [Tribolium castaneum]|eukprot:XP_008201023.1 PREDICTED: uncharacterized protein LOC103315068 [Tribolium castaneum]